MILHRKHSYINYFLVSTYTYYNYEKFNNVFKTRGTGQTWMLKSVNVTLLVTRTEKFKWWSIKLIIRKRCFREVNRFNLGNLPEVFVLCVLIDNSRNWSVNNSSLLLTWSLKTHAIKHSDHTNILTIHHSDHTNRP